MTDWAVITLAVVAVLIALAWYLSYTAARLDRLHAKAEGALSALDAQLVRRADATMDLATSGGLDPASSLLLADAATLALERHTAQPLTDDPLDGQSFAGMEGVEDDLTSALRAALTPDVVEGMRESEHDGHDAYERLESATLRVRLARSFLNGAVRDVRRVRRKRVVRLLRLAGHAPMPELVELDDGFPVGR